MDPGGAGRGRVMGLAKIKWGGSGTGPESKTHFCRKLYSHPKPSPAPTVGVNHRSIHFTPSWTTANTTVRPIESVENGICKELSTLSLNGDEEQLITEKPAKDPRRIARKTAPCSAATSSATDACPSVRRILILNEWSFFSKSLIGYDRWRQKGDHVTNAKYTWMKRYQIDLCKKALEENIVVYLETGSGKTHIAVLLIYEMGHLIRKPQKNKCIFLAPSVALVQQLKLCYQLAYEDDDEEDVEEREGTRNMAGRDGVGPPCCLFSFPALLYLMILKIANNTKAKVIEKSIDFKVGIFCGSSKHLKSHHHREKEIEDYELDGECRTGILFNIGVDWESNVLVMTPEILLHNLSHCIIKIEFISLLIFDECHYAQLESNHPYAEIMKIFYKMDVAKLPRIFGMTASPKLGKGCPAKDSQLNYSKFVFFFPFIVSRGSLEGDTSIISSLSSTSQLSLASRKGGSIDGLEALLRAKVYSVEDKDELKKFVTSPKVNVYYYGSNENSNSSPHMIYTGKLEEIKHQCMLALRMNLVDPSILRSTKKLLQKLHCNLIFCLENLGLWGALQAIYGPLATVFEPATSTRTTGIAHLIGKQLLQATLFIFIFQSETLLQASNIFRKGDYYENTELVEAEESCTDGNLCNEYLHRAASVLATDCTGDGMEADLSCVDVLKEPYFSRKLLRLIGILSSFRIMSVESDEEVSLRYQGNYCEEKIPLASLLNMIMFEMGCLCPCMLVFEMPDMKCIIFVNRIITARSLSNILRNLKFLSSWKCGFLVGVHAGLVSRKSTNIILEKFRSGEKDLWPNSGKALLSSFPIDLFWQLNLLVATKVGEEGLDIQTCCLVIRFDLPETVASFIQSRGRARMPQSEYAFLVNRGNLRELNLIEHFKKDEAQMNEEISLRKSHTQ
ncbi:Dicer-like protein 4 [Sesamum angolense]|uniref:Dicer-like protein 4 n=1 Tax=Sesamum angolense TaxID=2727404 RepID=A0AAE2BMZ8_9LAMI|nr:Dicer-like protein 4 [Sesamum angolense]